MRFFLNLFLEHFIKDKRFHKFIWVGIINTIFGYSIYALLIYCGLYYIWAVLFATIIGVLFNFHTTGRIVFKNKQSWLLFKFIAVYVLTYFLNISIIKILTNFCSNQYLNGAATLLVSVPVAFLLNKLWVFRGKYEIN